MDDIKWLIGTLIGVVALVGGLVTRDRQMANQIRAGDDRLHERINRTRDEYVRRDDLDGQIRRLESSVTDMRDEMRHSSTEINKRFDSVMETLGKLENTRT